MPTVKYPCVVCDTACFRDSMQCAGCRKKVHGLCLSAEPKELESWKSRQLSFQCPDCAFSDGHYDAVAALERLQIAYWDTRPYMLRNVALSESKLLEIYKVDIRATSWEDDSEDKIAREILQNYHPAVVQKYRPVPTIGDGNCLYRTVSKSLTGSEDFHPLLRLKTSLEIIFNDSVYNRGTKSELSFLNDQRIITSPYDKLVRDAIHINAFAELVHIYALSAALGITLQSYYPPQFHSVFTSEPLTRRVVGRGVGDYEPDHTIMWTMTSHKEFFEPNHFVPLVQRHKRPEPTIIVEDDDKPYTSTRNSLASSSKNRPKKKKVAKTTHVKFANRFSPLQTDSDTDDFLPDLLNIGNPYPTIDQGNIDRNDVLEVSDEEPPASKPKHKSRSKNKSRKEKKPHVSTSSTLNVDDTSIGNKSGVEHNKVCSGNDIEICASSDSMSSTLNVGANNVEHKSVEKQVWSDDDDFDNSVSSATIKSTLNLSAIEFEHRSDEKHTVCSDDDFDISVSNAPSATISSTLNVSVTSTVNNDGQNSNECSDDDFDLVSSIRREISETDEYVSNDVEDNNSESWEIAPNGGDLINGQFLGINDVIEQIVRKHITSSVLDNVPRGLKENKYFVIDNTKNVGRRESGLKSEFWDDCGAWLSGGPTNKSIFSAYPEAEGFDLGKLQKVVRKNEMYCLERKRDKKIVHLPLDRQPSNDEILVVHRYYLKHKLSSSYQKRVTWLERAQYPYALVEYKGIFPGRAAHGKAVGNKTKYERLKPEIIKNIKESTGCRPQDLYNKYDIIEGPRNIKQVRDAKYRSHKENKIVSAGSTFSDQILALESLQVDLPFVQLIVRRPGKVPCCVLYTKEQISDIRRFCCSTPGVKITVLGVDKTFNLGELFLTTTIFKHLGVLHSKTEEHPLIPGPMFLHGDSDVNTYFVFFQHLAGVLGNGPSVSQPILGSDEEQAIRVAFMKAFPGAKRLSCVRHLKKNTDRHLQDKIGMSSKERKDLCSKIFGREGLVATTDTVTFEIKLSVILESLEANQSEFVSYFTKRIAPLLKDNMEVGSRPGLVGVTPWWTNNNCESFNHVIKQYVQWKPNKLVDLVTKLHNLVKNKYMEITRCIIGRGELILDSGFKQYQLDGDKWVSLSVSQRTAHMRKFGNCYPVFTNNISIGRDGNHSVQTPKHGSKKPGQRKRKRVERTASAKKLKL